MDKALLTPKSARADYRTLARQLSEQEVQTVNGRKTEKLRSILEHGVDAPLEDHHAVQRNLQDKAYFDHALRIAEDEKNPKMLKRLIQAIPFLKSDEQRAAYNSTDKALEEYSDPDIHAFAQVYRAAAECNPKLQMDIKLSHDMLYKANPMQRLVLVRDPETNGLQLTEIAQTQKEFNLDSDIGQAFWAHLNTDDHVLSELAKKSNDARLLSHDKADFRVIVHFLEFRLPELDEAAAKILRQQINACPNMDSSLLPSLLETTTDEDQIKDLCSRQYGNDTPE